MFVPNFKILGQVVAEKSLTEKKVYKHTNIRTEKAQTIYPLYTWYTGGIKILERKTNGQIKALISNMRLNL